MFIIHYCKLVYNKIIRVFNFIYIKCFDKQLHGYIMVYMQWILVFIIVCYNICIGEPFFNMNGDMGVQSYIIDHLPHYQGLLSFMEIKEDLCNSVNSGCWEDIDYQLLEASLDEIDYPIRENYIPKSIKYIQWHQLEGWSVEDEKSWNNVYNYIMESGHGNWTDDFEKMILKYVLREGPMQQYRGIKYTSWRFMESLYVKNLLFHMKELSTILGRWYAVKGYVENRLISPRRGTYLFRCYDTYLNLYCRYEIVQLLPWTQALNNKILWLFNEHYYRQPRVILRWTVIKIVCLVLFVYGWYPFVPSF